MFPHCHKTPRSLQHGFSSRNYGKYLRTPCSFITVPISSGKGQHPSKQCRLCSPLSVSEHVKFSLWEREGQCVYGVVCVRCGVCMVCSACRVCGACMGCGACRVCGVCLGCGVCMVWCV